MNTTSPDSLDARTIPLHGVTRRACCGHGRNIFFVGFLVYAFRVSILVSLGCGAREAHWDPRRHHGPLARPPRGKNSLVDRHHSLHSRRGGYSHFARILGPGKNIKMSHTHTPTENTTPDTDTHTHDKNNTPNPQTSTSQKHVTTLEGSATQVITSVSSHSKYIFVRVKHSVPVMTSSSSAY